MVVDGVIAPVDATVAAMPLLVTSTKLATLHANITARMLLRIVSPATNFKDVSGAPTPNHVTTKTLHSVNEKPNALLANIIDIVIPVWMTLDANGVMVLNLSVACHAQQEWNQQHA